MKQGDATMTLQEQLEQRIKDTQMHRDANDGYYSRATLSDYMETVLQNQLVILKALQAIVPERENHD